jgi:pyruvate/2-oxoglutarate dehydrogenase complex dihydrolipoamide dehydrogenase (E3) component
MIVKGQITEEKLKHFIEVSETINELIQNKNIFNQPEKIDNETLKVAVIGSGIMGSGIACHFANIGVEVLLLDIVPREH